MRVLVMVRHQNSMTIVAVRGAVVVVDVVEIVEAVEAVEAVEVVGAVGIEVRMEKIVGCRSERCLTCHRLCIWGN